MTAPSAAREHFLSAGALRRAFARVRENHGCPGVDEVGVDDFGRRLEGETERLRSEVLEESYCAWPLRLIEVAKRPDSAERRRLLVPAVRDRVLQTAVATYIEPALEKEFDDCSFAYRRGRSVAMAVERVHALYRRGYVWLVDADIDDCFDSLDRELAIGRLHTVVHDELAVRLARLWLDYTVWDGLHLRRTERGIPQGAVISPMLANLCLDRLDDRMVEAGVQMVRYADDFVLLARSHKAADKAMELAEETIRGLRLRLDPVKSRVCRFSDGFRFLGAIFLKDMLLRPWKAGGRGSAVLSFAGPMPEEFYPRAARMPLRKYRVV